MSGFLLDTHIWYWQVVGSGRLAAGLRGILEDDRSALWLSPVSVWELALLVDRGRLEIDLPMREWVASGIRALSLREAPLTYEVALRSREVALPHGDPADRFLAATALVLDLTLLTVDRRLTRARGIPTRSR